MSVAWRDDLREVLGEGAGVGCGPFVVGAVGCDEGDVFEVPLELALGKQPWDSGQGKGRAHWSITPRPVDDLKAGYRDPEAFEVGSAQAEVGAACVSADAGYLVDRGRSLRDDAIADAKDARRLRQGAGRGFLHGGLRGIQRA